MFCLLYSSYVSDTFMKFPRKDVSCLMISVTNTRKHKNCGGTKFVSNFLDTLYLDTLYTPCMYTCIMKVNVDYLKNRWSQISKRHFSLSPLWLKLVDNLLRRSNRQFFFCFLNQCVLATRRWKLCTSEKRTFPSSNCLNQLHFKYGRASVNQMLVETPLWQFRLRICLPVAREID